MNSELSINQAAVYAQKARMLRRLKGPVRLLLTVAAVAMGGFGVLLLVFNFSSALGFLLVGWSMVPLMVTVWYAWELKPLRGSIDRETLNRGRFEQMVDAEAAAVLRRDLSPQQLFKRLEDTTDARFIMARLGIHPSNLEGSFNTNASELGPILRRSIEIAQAIRDTQVSTGALVVALLESVPNIDSYLASLKIRKEDMLACLEWLGRGKQMLKASQEHSSFGGFGRDWAAGYTPILNRLGYNMSFTVSTGNTGETDLHSGTVKQMIAQLQQARGRNVVLIGDSGSGKTRAVEELAEQMLIGGTEQLRYYHIFRLEAGRIIGSANSFGGIENTLARVFVEAARAKNVILFLDDAHLFFSQGAGALDVANVLLPLLQKDAVPILLSIDPRSWQTLQQNHGPVASALNVIRMPEPPREQAIKVLQDQALYTEARANVTFAYQAIETAYELSERYYDIGAQPGKGIKLMDVSVTHANNKYVASRSIEQAIESTMSVKVSAAQADERDVLLNLEDRLHERMVNQNRAVEVVAGALRRARAGVRNPERPVGSFLFLGPTGVGKTELTKSLAHVYFGGKDHMIRIDMSEYSQASDVSRVLGTDTSDSLLLQVRRQPFSVILFDEIEKAHPDILNLFLQVLDDGRLTDTDGRTVSFKDAIIIATSNAGADRIRAYIQQGWETAQFEERFVDELIDTKQFRPEFLNRFDEIVVFRPLKQEELKQVVGLLLAEVNTNLAKQQISVTLTEAATEWLAEQGYDPRLGARPLRRMMQRSVENILAHKLLTGEVHSGDTVTLDAHDLESV